MALSTLFIETDGRAGRPRLANVIDKAPKAV